MGRTRPQLLRGPTMGVHINASVGSGTTLSKLQEILDERMSRMNETARGSIAACML